MTCDASTQRWPTPLTARIPVLEATSSNCSTDRWASQALTGSGSIVRLTLAMSWWLAKTPVWVRWSVGSG